MVMKILVITQALLVLLSVCSYAQDNDGEKGYLDTPPIFIDSEIDFPLTGMGIEMPKPHEILPDTDFMSLKSNGFNQNGVNVQPSLSVKYDVVRLGALYGLSKDWAAGISIPWYKIQVQGAMAGGFPSSSAVKGIGGINIGGKTRLWSNNEGCSLVATGMIQLPNGLNHATFNQSNAATDRYFTGSIQRMPLSWQPSSGTINGYLGLAYGKTNQRLSYVGLVATKLHTSDDEDVKIGNIFVVAGAATYGVARRLAAAFGLTLRVQADDNYPNAPAPGVEAFPTMATPTHGTTLFVDPSIRFIVTRNIAVGVGIRIPVVKPDNGLVPDTRFNVIFYPGF
jgi:hypothetical protein